MNSLDSKDLTIVRSAESGEFIQSNDSDHKQNSGISKNDGDTLNEDENVPKTIEVNGLSGHYHTGDVVQLVADSNEDESSGNFQWYIRSDEGTWVAVADQNTKTFEYTTTGKSFEVKAVLYDEEEKQQAQSESIEVTIDDHEGLDPHVC